MTGRLAPWFAPSPALSPGVRSLIPPDMRLRSREDESGPATLGSTARAHLLLRVWCNNCRRVADLDPGEQAKRHGADLDLLAWRSRLRCSKCGSRNVDAIVHRGRTGGIGDR